MPAAARRSRAAEALIEGGFDVARNRAARRRAASCGPGALARDTPLVFLDCDGVLADFDAGARRVLGMAPHEFEQRFGLAQFWARLEAEPDFFGTLDVLPDARELYEAVRRRGPVILTGLPRGAWAEPQKRRWAQRHFPGVEVITTSAALKREHCRPGDVLVDDRDTYRHLWRRAGGIFVHHTGAARSIAELRRHGFLEGRAAQREPDPPGFVPLSWP